MRINTRCAGTVRLLLLLLAFVLVLQGPGRAEVDSSKLKPGDKLEMERFDEWIPVEVEEVIQGGWIRVRAKDMGIPILVGPRGLVGRIETSADPHR